MAFQFPQVKNNSTVETWKLQLFYLFLGPLFTWNFVIFLSTKFWPINHILFMDIDMPLVSIHFEIQSVSMSVVHVIFTCV